MSDSNFISILTLKFLRVGAVAGIVSIAACVSVNIPAPSKQKSSVTLAAPKSPFEKAALEGTADSIWRNPKTGNNISYFSQCGDQADPELEAIRNEMALGLSEMQIVTNSRFSYNSREALRSSILGKVDGVPTQIDVVVFKKNRCIYALTLVGIESRHSADSQAFEQFIDGFKAP